MSEDCPHAEAEHIYDSIYFCRSCGCAVNRRSGEIVMSREESWEYKYAHLKRDQQDGIRANSELRAAQSLLHPQAARL
jgi:hypothetical protein